MRRRDGFTLLESMLAASLLATMMVALQELFVQSQRVAVAIGAGFDFDRRVARLLRRLERALGGSSPYLQPEEAADFRGDATGLRVLTYRYHPPEGGPGRIAAVHLGQDPDGVFLEVHPPLWSAFGHSEARSAGRTLERLPEVRRFALDYFDGRDWKPDWALRRSLRLPRAVRLSLVLARPVPGGTREETAELVVPLPAERDVGIR